MITVSAPADSLTIRCQLRLLLVTAAVADVHEGLVVPSSPFACTSQSGPFVHPHCVEGVCGRCRRGGTGVFGFAGLGMWRALRADGAAPAAAIAAAAAVAAAAVAAAAAAAKIARCEAVEGSVAQGCVGKNWRWCLAGAGTYAMWPRTAAPASRPRAAAPKRSRGAGSRFLGAESGAGVCGAFSRTFSRGSILASTNPSGGCLIPDQ
jgi:hypothetical protein